MAIVATSVKNSVTIKLNNGTSESGTVSTINQSLGTLNGAASSWDATKAYTIVEALAPLFTKPVYEVQHVQTDILTDE